MITYIKKEVCIIFTIEFYHRENGKIPVLEYLNGLPAKLRAKAFKDIELLQEYSILHTSIISIYY